MSVCAHSCFAGSSTQECVWKVDCWEAKLEIVEEDWTVFKVDATDLKCWRSNRDEFLCKINAVYPNLMNSPFRSSFLRTVTMSEERHRLDWSDSLLHIHEDSCWCVLHQASSKQLLIKQFCKKWLITAMKCGIMRLPGSESYGRPVVSLQEGGWRADHGKLWSSQDSNRTRSSEVLQSPLNWRKLGYTWPWTRKSRSRRWMDGWSCTMKISFLSGQHIPVSDEQQ